MHRSPLSCQSGVAAVYLMLTGLKSVAITKPVRHLGFCQKSDWHLGYRIRATFANGQDRLMLRSIEADETYIGGKAKNQDVSQHYGKRGVGDKYLVAGILVRATGERTCLHSYPRNEANAS